jgi:integrase
MASRAIVMQTKTKRPVQFEISDQTKSAVSELIKLSGLQANDYLFQSRKIPTLHISTRQYAKLLKGWVAEVGLDPKAYGTHSLRRTKATLIYRRTKNLRAVQLLLGHSKVESTVRYLGIELDDALEIAEQTEI